LKNQINVAAYYLAQKNYTYDILFVVACIGAACAAQER